MCGCKISVLARLTNLGQSLATMSTSNCFSDQYSHQKGRSSYSSVKLTHQVANVLCTSESRVQSVCECALGGSDTCHPVGYGMASGGTPSAMNVLLKNGVAASLLCRLWAGAEMRLYNGLLQLDLTILRALGYEKALILVMTLSWFRNWQLIKVWSRRIFWWSTRNRDKIV